MPTRRRTEVRRNRADFGPWTAGVNELVEPYLLQKTELSDAGNVDLDTSIGKVLKRPGSTLIRGDITELVQTPRNAFEFIKSDGSRFLLITDDKKIVVTTDLVTFTELYPALIPGASVLDDTFFLEFETAQDKVWMTNGNDFVLSYDGITLVQYDKGTVNITWTAADVDDTQTTLKDVLLDRAGVGTWVGHIITCTSATNTGNIGITRTVTIFDDPTDKITFSGAFPFTILNGDKFKVGVQIPRGRAPRFHFSTFFTAATPENQSEIRFHNDVDPNEPNIVINIDNPNAWPAENQLTISENDGDRIWGLTPVFRDRFAAHKSTGLFRIDPHPTFRFIANTVTKQVGSRLPRTFKERDGLLMFIGNRADGLPEFFETDFVTVRDSNRKHSKTLENLKQPNQTLRSIIRGTTTEFLLGTASDTVSLSNGKIQLKRFNSQLLWESILSAATNIDIESSPGKIEMLGFADWDVPYDGSVFPNSATPVWNETFPAGLTRNISLANLEVFDTGGTGGIYKMSRANEFTDTKEHFVRARVARLGTANITINIENGTNKAVLTVSFAGVIVFNNTTIGTLSSGTFAEFAILLKTNGTAKLWQDGILKTTAPALASSMNDISITSAMIGAGSPILVVDYINYHRVYKGDILSNQNGKLLPTSLPATLPTTANIALTVDYKKALTPGLDVFGKYSFLTTLKGGTSLAKTSSSSDNISFSSPESILNNERPNVDNTTAMARFLKYEFDLTSAATEGLAAQVDELMGGGIYMADPLFNGADIASWTLFLEELIVAGVIDSRKIRRSTNASGNIPDTTGTTGWDTVIAGSDAEGFFSIAPNNNIGTILGDGSPPTSTFTQIYYSLSPTDARVSPEIDNFSVNWLEGDINILPANAIIFRKKYIFTGATQDSFTNNIIVIFDSSRSFYNWTGLNANHLFFFAEDLLFLRATLKDVLRISVGLFTDEGVPFTSFIETRQAILGDIGSLKKLRYMDVQGVSDLSTNTFLFKGDRDTVFKTIGTALFNATTVHKRINFPIGNMARRILLRSENSNDEDFGLNGIILGWEFQPSRAGRP